MEEPIFSDKCYKAADEGNREIDEPIRRNCFFRKFDHQITHL